MFLLFAGGVVIYLLIIFFAGKKRGPSSLNFRKDSKGLEKVVKRQGSNKSPQSDQGPPSPRERPLNVFFNYNGETFDAYEILGIPAGTSLEVAKDYYQKNYAAAPMNERAIYTEAIEALEKTG